MDIKEKLVEQKIKCDGESICYNCFHNKVCKAMDNQPCIECNQFVDANGVTVQEWTSVKDMVPTNLNDVLVFTKWRTMDVCFFYKEDESWISTNGSYSKNYVTHWIPLPQPPKGE